MPIGYAPAANDSEDLGYWDLSNPNLQRRFGRVVAKTITDGLNSMSPTDFANLVAEVATKASTNPATPSADGLLSAADKRKLDASLYVGEMRLFTRRVTELPQFWYACYGGGYAITSPQGQALNGLSATLKADWGITVSGSVIYLPNLISNGNGYFLRAVDNSTRLPGSVQGDAIRNITGGTSLILAAEASGGGYGAMSLTVSEFRSDLIEATGGYRAWASAAFNAANAVPVATENRPLNIGMTPAIYLGV